MQTKWLCFGETAMFFGVTAGFPLQIGDLAERLLLSTYYLRFFALFLPFGACQVNTQKLIMSKKLNLTPAERHARRAIQMKIASDKWRTNNLKNARKYDRERKAIKRYNDAFDKKEEALKELKASKAFIKKMNRCFKSK